eukprot:gnl/Dysnectes_brevis/3277_a4106_1014.p1 GENE.gnl/Dysnectes_brevis/3277_a4106_1014~~gnl/Dysnectes_brevis/3277_a4106_1014.p1  ORF type:complete len:140 (-),score=5.40 gnl/Dysnectes_brevis/3277_a4106_1014:78-497(-)
MKVDLSSPTTKHFNTQFTISESSRRRQLVTIKLIHSIIWIFMSSLIMFTLISGIIGSATSTVIAAHLIVVLEGLILVFFGWKCPLTILAERIVPPEISQTTPNFDIYLPRWLARWNKTIFTTLFMISALLLIHNLLGHT